MLQLPGPLTGAFVPRTRLCPQTSWPPLWKSYKQATEIIGSDSDVETAFELLFVVMRGLDTDRYVIIGNHYDAFVLGALDPNSGTAIMLELSRAFALLRKQGQLFPVYIRHLALYNKNYLRFRFSTLMQR